MDTKEVLLDELKEYESLYRFTNLDTFLNILLTDSLVLVKPDLWDDPHEMSLIKSSIDKSIEDICAGYEIAINDYRAVEGLIRIQYIIDNLYAQCWSTLSESDALWRIYYNEGKALRLCTKIDQIRKHKNLTPSIVTYNDSSEIHHCKTEYDFYKLSTTKRTAFSHEKEVRLIYYSDIDEDDLYARFLKLYKSDFLRRKNYILKTREEENELNYPSILKNSSVTIDDEIIKYSRISESFKSVAIEPSNFIDSVLVSPFAPKWFCQMIETLCGKYGINYIGQSTLYKK
ncbi:MAG: hypothetical protein PHT62_05330 [Desulfotomaculaceae bacterium]|nr:hypothetical protein [Desulfotomaculaceae bacterium]